MMKLLLSLTLTWALCHTGGALTCLTCTDAACSTSTSQTCSSETMCISASIRATSSGTESEVRTKSCAAAALCPLGGFHSYSANLGYRAIEATAVCCDTDDCNSVTLPIPLVQNTNTIKCETCDSSTSTQCTTTLQCLGAEDACIQANVTTTSGTTSVLGCASRNLCVATNGLGEIPFMETLGKVPGGTNCCGTDFCTTRSATTAAPAAQTTTRRLACAGSDACRIQMGSITLLLALLIYSLY